MFLRPDLWSFDQATENVALPGTGGLCEAAPRKVERTLPLRDQGGELSTLWRDLGGVRCPPRWPGQGPAAG